MQPVLDDALASFSTKDRVALILRFYHSLTVREIATTLVHSWVQRDYSAAFARCQR
jgi:DNA-directed RNA polymerase specialized sigma24 family protein